MLRAVALVLVLSAGLARAEENEDIQVSSEKVAGSEVPLNMVEGTIDAPPAKVWRIISDCANYAKTMPRIVKSAELSREGDINAVSTVKCQITVHLPFPLSDLTGITQAKHTVEPNVRYVRAWNLVSGDYHVNTGSWSLVAIDDGKRTRATYRIQVQPKIALPTSWMASAQKNGLKDVILKVRESVKNLQ